MDDSKNKFDLEPNPFEQSFAHGDSRRSSVVEPSDSAHRRNQSASSSSSHRQTSVASAVSSGQPPQKQPQPKGQQQHPPPGSRIISSGAGGQVVATPGGRRHLLPPVAALESPSSLIPGQAGAGHGIAASQWDGSLKSGPLSPALLQGPQPENPEHMIRTGLTPGGSGTMFPNPGPATAAILGLAADHSLLNGPPNNPTSYWGAKQQQQPPQPQPQPQQPPQQPQAQPRQVKPVNGHYMLGTQSQKSGPASKDQPQLNQHNSLLTHTPSSKSPISNNPPTTTSTTTKRKASKDEPLDPPKRSRQKSAGKKAEKLAPAADHGPSKSEDDSDGSKPKSGNDEKRKNFLERNRIAALKCRQRKKQWLASLEDKVERITAQNEELMNHNTILHNQLTAVKAILRSHKDCNIPIPPELLLGDDVGGVPGAPPGVPMRSSVGVPGPVDAASTAMRSHGMPPQMQQQPPGQGPGPMPTGSGPPPMSNQGQQGPGGAYRPMVPPHLTDVQSGLVTGPGAAMQPPGPTYRPVWPMS